VGDTQYDNLSVEKWNGRRSVGEREVFPVSCFAELDLMEAIEMKVTKRGINQVDSQKDIVIERVKKDFFGRTIVEENNDDGGGKRRRTDSSNALKIQPNVWVRFHEGYSNAVRKPVAFAELLGRV
jgi:hypothetical protein